VAPRVAVPEIVGLETSVGIWLVASVATDQMDVVPAVFTFVVLAVMNLPASVEVCEYVVEVAPEMIEH
jgi:uncharacterized membrane protein YphA (DoxX/SURF4 family)